MLKKIISTASAAVLAASLMLTTLAGVPAQDYTITSQALPSQVMSALPCDRTSGPSRYQTAVEVSKKSYPNGTKNVIIASGEGYADALCATPLAKQLEAPILLTEKDGLREVTTQEIARLGAENVYIFGGGDVVSEEVDKALTESELKVSRVAGETRFNTAVQAATLLTKQSKKVSDTAFFVYGYGFSDALSISSAAAVTGAPIFYVNKSGKLDEDTKAYLKSLNKTLDTAYIIGGTMAIDNAIVNELKPFFKSSVRYGGNTRYDTNAIINTSFKKSLTGKDLYLATGKNFPDALSGGAWAAMTNSAVVLADDTVSGKQLEYLKSYGITEKAKNTLHTIGGTDVVSNKTVQAVLLIEDPALTVADGGTKATLTWTRNRFITSYQIYRDGKLLTTVTDPYKLTYTDTNVYKESTYVYRIVYNYTIGGTKFTGEATKTLDRKVFDFRWLLDDTNSARLNSEKNNTPKYILVTENAQPAKSTTSSYDIRALKTGDWATLKKFADEHFTNSMTKAEKVAYTVNWINKNVWYGTVQNGGWSVLLSMVSNGTFSYVNCIFNKKIGQCNCYNGALASMMLYLGYDAHLVMGYRGVVNASGTVTSKWQHFWCEVKINGKTYVMEAGNYGEDGDWMHVCELYKDVESKYEYEENKVKKTGWRGYIKNGKIVL